MPGGKQRIKRTLWRTGATIVLLLVAILVVTMFYLGGVVKTTVETVGPSFTGGSVKLDQAHIYPLRGKMRLQGFVLGNPPGYDAPEAIRLQELKVDLKPLTAFQDTVHIKAVVVDGLEITFEGGPKQNNLKDLQKNIEAGGPEKAKDAKAPKEAPPTDADKPEKPATPPKYLIIDELVVRNAKVHFGTFASLPLPEIQMRDIGKDKPTTIADATELVLDAVRKSVDSLIKKGFEKLEEAGKEIEKAFKDGTVDGGAHDVADTINGLVNDLKKKDGSKKASKGLNEIGDEIGKLLGGKKKSDDE